MNRVAFVSLALLVHLLLLSAVVNASEVRDSEALRVVFDADQEARSPERLKQGVVPTLQEEKDRRTEVLRLISRGEVRTAKDHIRALIVLHHTPIWQDPGGKPSSFSLENHVLAFFLAIRAHELGHPQGLHFIAWTYNYYARGAGCDMERYGFEVVDGSVVANDSALTGQQRKEDCGFDPGPYIQGLP